MHGSPIDEAKEKEANLFAQKYLFPQAAYESLTANMHLNDRDFVEYAATYETHPAIIVGQLQHAGLIGYQQFNQFKVPINLFNESIKTVSVTI